MLNYNFNIKNYNWNVEVYYYITHFEIDDIDNKLRELACKGGTMKYVWIILLIIVLIQV